MSVRRTGTGASESQRTVLIATPSPKAARLISCGFQRLSVSTSVVPDGRSAITHLTREVDAGEDGHVPDLIVVDSALEGIGGEAVIDAIRSSPRLETLPIVLISDDHSTKAVENAYTLGVNATITTPDEVEAHVDCFEALATFWFEYATLPSECLYADSPF